MTRNDIDIHLVEGYLPTIGLEIHAELATNTKMFCACKNDPDEEKPNVNFCPICLGHPGTLPVLNFEAIKKVLEIGIALDAKIADFTEWDRKQYFYPDIPKGYQISQYAYPLVSGGTLAGVEIERIHLEEDTAQSTHDTHHKSLINFNRSGVPLMELVTKPFIHDAKTAVHFAKELQLLLRYLGAGEANLEKGEMRVEANISVKKKVESTQVHKLGKEFGELGTKTEVKNLNSFRAVEKSIEYEIKRQIELIEKGEKVIQETRGWDDKKNETYSQRSKESAHDYRYFPEPDIPKMKLSEMKEFTFDNLKKEMPELPWKKRERFMNEYKATQKEADMFVDNPNLANHFDKIAEEIKKEIKSDTDAGKAIRLAMNYLLTDYLGALKAEGAVMELIGMSDIPIPPSSWAELITMLMKNELSSRGAKEIITLMIQNPTQTPKELAKKYNLIQDNDAETLKKRVVEVIEANKGVLEDYRKGKTASIQFLIGQVMKVTKGSANPSSIREILIEILKEK